MESLDRPYGDDENDYTTVDPEGAAAERAGDEELESLDEIDGDAHAGDPAFRAVEEAGGGVAEGFEEAERELIEHTERAPDADRTLDGFDLNDPGVDVDEDAADEVERVLEEHEREENYAVRQDDEAREVPAQYGEPDQVDVTEVVRDPREGDDDPGAGPGVASER